MLARAVKLGVSHEVSNLFQAYFQPYIRKERDESNVRQAAKNSFVGSGAACLLAPDNDLGDYFGAPTTAMVASASMRVPIRAPETAPICPPVFEGDYWVIECARLHRCATSRSRSDDGQEKDANKRRAREILKSLMSNPSANSFNKPVDPVALLIPDYPTIITSPMDLGTVREKLRKGEYANFLEFAQDIRLTFHNAMKYNHAQHYIHIYASTLLKDLERSLQAMVVSISGLPCDASRLDNMLISYPLYNEPVAPSAASSSGSSSVRSGKDFHFFSSDAGGGSISPRAASSSSSSSSSSGSAPMVISSLEHANGSSANGNAGGGEGGGGGGGGANGFEEAKSVPMEADDDEQRSGDGEGNASDDEGHKIQRQDSLESILGESGSAGGDDFSRSARPNHTNAMFGAAPEATVAASVEPFTVPELGFRGAMSLMSDLSRGVERLKSDLFVIKFANPNAAVNPSKKRKLASEDEAHVVVSHSWDNRGKGPRGKANKSKSSQPSLKRQSSDEHSISDVSQALLKGLATDTSDPDEELISPFVDCRHTFLEMCQFRHYEFNTLRRAKHSSLMLLYHLHNPDADNTRPTCCECKGIITDLRWHCGDGCGKADTCNMCYNSKDFSHDPEHKLVPFRVTYAPPSTYTGGAR